MNSYDTKTFLSDLEKLGITLSNEQLEQFLIYYEMLVEWNEKMNLTAITDFQDVMKKHFVDSVSLIKAYDVGSHAVYPRASNVARSPPDGKLEASGSPFTSSLPENSKITLPSCTGEIKLSCFSAVIPVIG